MRHVITIIVQSKPAIWRGKRITAPQFQLCEVILLHGRTSLDTKSYQQRLIHSSLSVMSLKLAVTFGFLGVLLFCYGVNAKLRGDDCEGT